MSSRSGRCKDKLEGGNIKLRMGLLLQFWMKIEVSGMKDGYRSSNPFDLQTQIGINF